MCAGAARSLAVCAVLAIGIVAGCVRHRTDGSPEWLILIGLFIYYPAASGVYHSFFRWNGADISEFVGVKN